MVLDAQGPGHVVLVGGALRLFGRVEAAVHQFLQQRVVQRDLLDVDCRARGTGASRPRGRSVILLS